MAECKQEVFEFQAHGSRKVTADFSRGYLSSDGGAVFLRGVDLRMGLDPLHALIAGKADVLGEDRLCEGDKGKALAAHSTLNRLELGVLGVDAR